MSKDICMDCGQEIETLQVGLINFGDRNHYKNCPARQFEHCPNCGIDLDVMNSHCWPNHPMKGIYKREKWIMEKFGK